MEPTIHCPAQHSIIIELESLPQQTSSPKNTLNHIGISIKELSDQDISTTDQLEDEKHPQCPICWSTTSLGENITLKDCKHSFCRECLAEYLKSSLNSFKILNIGCPSSECKSVFMEDAIKQILEEETFKKYQEAVLKKLISQNTETKFCPKPGCAYGFKPSSKSLYTVCICKTKVCNVCCNTWHEGRTCIEAIDSEFQMFAVGQGIKFCMMCKSHVQRVEGCKHITCPVCDYEWCWDCGRQYQFEHEEECPQSWSPVPPPVSKLMIWRRRWNDSSKAQKVGLAIGGFLLTPIMLIGFMLLWPLWYKFDMKKHLNRRNPVKSAGVVIVVVVLAILYLVVNAIVLLLMTVILINSIILSLPSDIYACLRAEGNSSGVNNNQNRAVEETDSPRRRWTRRNADDFRYTANAQPQNNA